MDLEWLRTLTHVTGRLNAIVPGEDLSRYGCLRRVDGTLAIWGENLRSLEGMSRLEEVGLGIVVTGNPKLESLRGLTSLREVPRLEIHYNAALTALELDDLEHAGYIQIGGCEQVSGHGDVELSGNPALTELDDFDALTSFDFISITGNEALVSLDGLRSLADRGAGVGGIGARRNASLPTEHAEEIVALFPSGGVCGNLGDESDLTETCPCQLPD
jgi:hypothetical protein